jgi:hypothetical protein
VEAVGEVRAGAFDLAVHVPLDGALADAEQLGDRFRPVAVLLDEAAHLRPGRTWGQSA